MQSDFVDKFLFHPPPPPGTSRWQLIRERLDFNWHSLIILLALVTLLYSIAQYRADLLEKQMIAVQSDPRPWHEKMDWLLVSIFSCLALIMMAGAELNRDGTIAFVGFFGGLMVEGWGTQTGIWIYYTRESPPLWIIPMWSIATLAIHRLYTLTDSLILGRHERVFKFLYWFIFPLFCAFELDFVWDYKHLAYTQFICALYIFISLFPRDCRTTVLMFAVGSGLGYFLEVWGTTRQCWIYYNEEKPPLFAVFGHGMAAVAFWRISVWLSYFVIFVNKVVFKVESSDQ